jgi:hypothetical protein
MIIIKSENDKMKPVFIPGVRMGMVKKSRKWDQLPCPMPDLYIFDTSRQGTEFYIFVFFINKSWKQVTGETLAIFIHVILIRIVNTIKFNCHFSNTL